LSTAYSQGGLRLDRADMIGALENEQDDRVKVNGLFGSLNDWKG
jgi:hypothetical protein